MQRVVARLRYRQGRRVILEADRITQVDRPGVGVAIPVGYRRTQGDDVGRCQTRFLIRPRVRVVHHRTLLVQRHAARRRRSVAHTHHEGYTAQRIRHRGTGAHAAHHLTRLQIHKDAVARGYVIHPAVRARCTYAQRVVAHVARTIRTIRRREGTGKAHRGIERQRRFVYLQRVVRRLGHP